MDLFSTPLGQIFLGFAFFVTALSAVDGATAKNAEILKLPMHFIRRLTSVPAQYSPTANLRQSQKYQRHQDAFKIFPLLFTAALLVLNNSGFNYKLFPNAVEEKRLQALYWQKRGAYLFIAVMVAFMLIFLTTTKRSRTRRPYGKRPRRSRRDLTSISKDSSPSSSNSRTVSSATGARTRTTQTPRKSRGMSYLTDVRKGGESPPCSQCQMSRMVTYLSSVVVVTLLVSFAMIFYLTFEDDIAGQRATQTGTTTSEWVWAIMAVAAFSLLNQLK